MNREERSSRMRSMVASLNENELGGSVSKGGFFLGGEGCCNGVFDGTDLLLEGSIDI